MTIKKYNNQSFREFQSAALREKGGELQVQILEHARDSSGADFISWVEGKMKQHSSADSIFEGEESIIIPDRPEKFSSQEFKQVPFKTAKILWDAWKDVNPGAFCSPAVWGYIVSRFVHAERISPYFLMVGSNGGKTTGKEEIDQALQAEKKEKAIDRAVRTFLRRFSGIHERGTRSLYHDCPIAMAWWQCYITAEITGDVTGEHSEKVFDLLNESGVWAKLTEKMASKLTVIGDKNIRRGLILFLLEEQEAKKNLDGLLKGIGVMSGWRGLGLFEPEQIRNIIAGEIYPNYGKKSNDKHEAPETSH